MIRSRLARGNPTSISFSQVGGVKVPGTRQNHVPGQAITLKSDIIVPAGRESTHEMYEIYGVVVPGTYDFMLS